MAPGIVADIVGKLSVRLNLRPGQLFRCGRLPPVNGFHQPPRETDALDNRLQILAIAIVAFIEIAEVDDRHVPRIR